MARHIHRVPETVWGAYILFAFYREELMLRQVRWLVGSDDLLSEVSGI